MDVSIIIVNYNTPELVRDCVRSVIRFTTGLSYEIIVVDNASTRGDVSATLSEFADVRIILSDRNLGFAGGNNLGIAQARAAYILLLNSDTYFTENALLPTWNFIRSRPDCGVVSAKLVYPDGRHQSVAQRFPSVKHTLIELLRLQKFIGKDRAGKLLLGSFFDHEQTVEADWVWGAFFLFPRTLLQQLPGQKLDDSYFMYWEDVQWCRDIRNAGYKVWFFSGATVVHIHEGSKSDKSQQIAENEQLFLKRNYSRLHRSLLHFFKAFL